MVLISNLTGKDRSQWCSGLARFYCNCLNNILELTVVERNSSYVEFFRISYNAHVMFHAIATVIIHESLHSILTVIFL